MAATVAQSVQEGPKKESLVCLVCLICKSDRGVGFYVLSFPSVRMMATEENALENELNCLKSIYFADEFQVISSDDEETKAIFFAFLQLPDNYIVKYKELLESTEYSYLKVNHLPPIELQLRLRKDYPSKEPPKFVIRCQWLDKSQISQLCQKLDDIWDKDPNTEIIFSYCGFLQNEILSFLNIEDELDISKLHETHLLFMKEKKETYFQDLEKGDHSKNANKSKGVENYQPSNGENSDKVKANGKSYSHRRNYHLKEHNDNVIRDKKQHSRGDRYNKRNYRNDRGKQQKSRPQRQIHDRRAVIPLTLSTSPVDLLKHYNMEREMIEFVRNCYTCNICITDKLGKDCTKFQECGHVFCKSCIQDYFTCKIKDGSVLGIKCPEPECKTEALPSQVKEMVSEQLFAKYDSLLLNTALDTLNDIVYCPRSFCQYPVSKEPDEQLAVCPHCQYTFCIYCKMVYHGVEPCKFKSEEKQKLIQKYQEASSEGKLQMELRYGKKQLESLVNNSMAESWIKNNSKPCPHCSAAIEKSQGCNKMVCWKCNTFFCWLCEAELDQANPYFHFSDPYSRCNNKLFFLVDTEEEPEEWEDWDWVEESEDEDFSDIEFDEAAVYLI